MQLNRGAVLAAACLLTGSVFSSGAGSWSTRKIKTVTPQQISDPLPNPDMGWGIWGGPRFYTGKPFSLAYNTTGFGDDAPLFGWTVADWMWADMEPAEGQYDWAYFDRFVEYWSKRHKQFFVRLWVTDDPGWNGSSGNEACPDWVWKAGAKFREYTVPGSKLKKREPDYLDLTFQSVYLHKLRNFLQAFAARYDKPGTPFVALQVSGYGQWGEWHTLWSKYPFPNARTKHDLLTKIVDVYSSTFKNIPLYMSFCMDHDEAQIESTDDFLYRQAIGVGMERGFGLVRFGFIDGLHVWDKNVMERYWPTHPLLTELNWPYNELMDERTHGTLDENLDVILEWHSNFTHYYLDADSYKRAMRENPKHFERGLQAGGLGYRLVVQSASWPEELSAGSLLVLRETWKNLNAGRLYRRYPQWIYLVDSQGKTHASMQDYAFDETSWVDGKQYPVTSVVSLPKDLRPGDYTLQIALVDGTNKPAIRLGIVGGDRSLRYPLGTIHILAREQQ